MCKPAFIKGLFRWRELDPTNGKFSEGGTAFHWVYMQKFSSAQLTNMQFGPFRSRWQFFTAGGAKRNYHSVQNKSAFKKVFVTNVPSDTQFDELR